MIHSSFDPLDPKYRCFFGLVHVKTATNFLAYVNLTLTILFTISAISNLNVLQVLVVAFVSALIIGAAIYGVATEKAQWLIPYLFSSGLYLALNFIIIVIGLITLLVAAVETVATRSERRNYIYEQRDWYEIKYDIIPKVLLVFFLYAFKLGICIWSYMVVYRCFQFFVGKKEASRLPRYQTSSFGNPTFSNAPETKSSIDEVNL
uniref:Uncharacterized protein n=1 Tax=Panagrolaimus sp. ES5 TaxID=591445 RepID=A0AC34FRZ3_9BILA